jgi:hypothetical protein
LAQQNIKIGKSPTGTNDDGSIRHYQWTFKFFEKDGKHLVHIWLTDAMFSVVKLGHFDSYVLKFKFVGKDNQIPKDLERTIYGYFKMKQPTVSRAQKKIGAV